MTQRNRAPKDARTPLPTTTKAPRASMIGRTHSKFARDWPSWKKTLWPFPSSNYTAARYNPSSRIHHRILWLTSLATLSFVFRPTGEKRGYVSDNGTEPIVSARENGLTRRHWLRARAVTVFNNNYFDTPGLILEKGAKGFTDRI